MPKLSLRLRALIVDQLQQGLHPRELALAIALGGTVGVMPLIWGTSILCIFLAGCFRLNQAVVQLANFLAYPLQIILFIPLLVLGDKFFSTTLLPSNSSQLLDQMATAPGLFFRQFWQANLQALSVWLISTPLLLAVFFCLAYLILKWVKFIPEESKYPRH